MTGKFITFEGGEGSGKSTQLGMLLDAFSASGLSCIKTREPGGSPGAEQIRDLLVKGAVDAWDATTETLLFYAARLDHVNKVIRPMISAGTHVICDRFADSTRVYQGVGKGLSDDFISDLHRLTLGDFMPDLTIILDIDQDVGLERTRARSGDETRFESMTVAFHQKVRQGFLNIARSEPKRCLVIDAKKDQLTIHKQIVEAMNTKLLLDITSRHNRSEQNG